MSSETRRRSNAWAIFNFEVDPDNFAFPVALGAAVTGDDYGYEERVDIRIHELGKVVKNFHVFLHSDMSRSTEATDRLVRRKLEVVSPVDANAVESVCKSQLSLALRLFRVSPFWITSWEHRREVRVSPIPSTVYSLRGEDLSRFRGFAETLLQFQEIRNVFNLVRTYAPLIKDWLPDFVGPTDPSGKKFLARTASLLIATSLFEEAQENWWLSNELRLILLFMAAEAIFSDDDRGENVSA